MKNVFVKRAGLPLLVGAFLAVGLVAMADISGNILPQSDGTYRSWTPKSGSTHYTMVDEATCNGTTDYVYTQSLGASDSYNYSLVSVPNGAIVTGLEITPCASANKKGGGPSKLNVFYAWNGNIGADYGSYLLTGTTPTNLAPTNITGLSFVKASSSNLEAGVVYDVASTGNKGLRVSRLAVRVAYTPLFAPSNLTATPGNPGSVDLAWTDNSSTEDGFKIEQSIDGSSFWQFATVGPNVTTYHHGGQWSGHVYAFRVRAYNSGGASAYSNTATTTIP